MPESSGIAFNNLLNASNPPAEAPIPTTGNKFDERILSSFLFDLLIVKKLLAARFDVLGNNTHKPKRH